jgi:hypothetical protein
MLAEIANQRPARRQAAPRTGTNMSAAAASGEYNIWYHKKSGRDREARKPAGTRVNVAKDCGRTAGNDNATAFICINFAKGCCSSGEGCRFLHRPPLQLDLERLDVTHDIFGRERHATNRTDMSGVGSWGKDQRTLYVGRLDPSCTEKQVRAAFDEFGELESCRVFAQRGFAFVTYRHRGCCEFGLQAMMDQRLGEAPMINVRWAEDDPNPGVKKRKAAETERIVGAAVSGGSGEDAALEARLEALRGGGGTSRAGTGGAGLAGWQIQQQQHEEHARRQQEYQMAVLQGQGAELAYPDTDAQFERPPAQPVPVAPDRTAIVANSIAAALAKASGGGGSGSGGSSGGGGSDALGALMGAYSSSDEGE